VKIRPATAQHVEQWAALRAALWDWASVEEHRNDIVAMLGQAQRKAAFVAVSSNGTVAGFAEASLRFDYVNGCDTSPVVFLEGIYVRPEHRRTGVARALCDEVAAWGRLMGCTEFASDALLENTESHAFHKSLGFRETERVIYFRTAL